MRIKKLEISGFKSFGERARLQFGDGITGVVGPNGCGKSNVVDAIRWCMGEQSAKNLRGRGMQDVIFAGSTQRAAQNMAEVTLTFDNDGNVPPAYLNFSEIAVTRRLFRDGSSEYLINRSAVRLRDVTDLFLGTGVGTRAYSIIEQGRIGFVVNSRPEERRTLIEEVAGITKFKIRKKAAERRMESTEQNLARVRDVVQELERQLGSLKRQADKAERFVRLREKLRDVELHQATLELLRHTQKAFITQRQRDELSESVESTRGDTASEEALIVSGREQLALDGDTLSQLQEESGTQEALLAGLVRDVAHGEEQVQRLAEAHQRAARELEEAAEKIKAAQAELAQLQAEEGALEEAAVGAESQTAEQTEQLERAMAALDEADGHLGGLREELMGQHRDMADKQAELRAASHARQQAEAACERDAAEQEALLPQRAATQTRLAALTRDVQERQEQLQGAQNEVESLSASLPALRESRSTTTQKARTAETELQKKSSRKNSLEQIISRLEGYSDGVRRLWPKGKPAISGLTSLVAAVLEVPDQFERAVEAVLGERLQYLVAENPDVVRAAWDLLQQQGGGRAGFVPLALPSSTVVPSEAQLSGEGVLGCAADLVSAPRAPRGLLSAFLGHVVLVDTWEAALREAEKHPASRLIWVTADGHTLDSFGVANGGVASQAGLLATRREIRELQREVQMLESERDAAEAARLTALEAVDAAEVALKGHEQSLHRCEVELTRLTKDKEAQQRELGRQDARLQELADGLSARREHARKQADEAQRLEAAAAHAQEGQEALSERLESAQEVRREAQMAVTQARESETAIRVRVAAAKERLSAQREAKARLLRQVEELGARQAQIAAMQTENATEAQQVAEKLAHAQGQVAGTEAACESARSAWAQAREAFAQAQASLTAREETLKSQRQTEGALKEQLVELRLESERLVAARQQLLSQVLERHDVDLLSVAVDYHDRAAPTAEALREQGELARQIKAMGAINLAAIEECRAVEERYTFLVAQRDDLEEALSSLKQAILRINRTSRERFTEAFESVNRMFKEVYPRLFRGGEARLELTAHDDVLEAGVEIIASPPGKKLQSVNLLSGGEKALTATAVVFAIFLIKPSPFCILDEVDAPLDEANVGRFNEMLRDISQVSQFIVITHNKQTMLQMDRLYGITMEQPGMSKVVSVDLTRQQQTEAA